MVQVIIASIIVGYVAWLMYRKVTDYTHVTHIQDLSIPMPHPKSLIYIQDLIGFREHFNQGVVYRHVGLLNDSSATIQKVKLNHSSGLPYTNENIDVSGQLSDITSFYSDVNETIETALRIDRKIDLTGGCCSYRRIVKELKILKRSIAKRRILVVDSPLIEHLGSFDNTTAEGRLTMSDNPWEAARLLNEERSIPFLRGIKIVFSYSPSDAQDAARYYGMIEVYKRLFVCQSAQIQIVHPNKTMSYE